MTHEPEPRFHVTQVRIFAVLTEDGSKKAEFITEVKRDKKVADLEQYRRMQELKYSRDLNKQIEIQLNYKSLWHI